MKLNDKASEERSAWRKEMGFPEPDAPQLPPPAFKQDTEYYLARLAGQLIRLELLFKSRGWMDGAEVETLKSAKRLLDHLYSSIDKNRVDVT